jgi:hypothetical protein
VGLRQARREIKGRLGENATCPCGGIARQLGQPKDNMMLPARYAPILFGLLLSGMMSLIVSGLSTIRALGWVDHLALIWMGNWAVSWATAFPVVLVVAPITRRVVARLIRAA